ncbi:MAG: hypothetical protein LBF59_03055 [Prevotellaceae bacterium]|jgi:uncharacterized protein YacL|nr:hypothetical protein [Prevotellaceae bacterium]
MMIRYFWAIIWTCFLVSFAYGDLVINFFLDNSVSFEQELIKLLNSKVVFYSNFGLVIMVLIDNTITKKITKKNTRNNAMIIFLCISIIIILFLNTLADKVVEEQEKLYDGFRLYYLFIIFLVCLIVSKAESLNIKHVSLEIVNTKIEI